MKKITFLFILLVISLGYSQQAILEDFEGAEPETAWFDAGPNATVAVSSAESAGTGTKSLQLITEAAGQNWQGASLMMQNKKIDMRTADKTVSFDVYSMSGRNFLVKLASADAGSSEAQNSKTFVTHPGGGWAKLTADFNVAADTGQPGYNPPNDQFSAIIFYPFYDSSSGPAGGWFDAAVSLSYIDNFTAIAGDDISVTPPGPTPPNVQAPLPPNRMASDVVSIYSDSYEGGIAYDNFDAGWCGGAAVTPILIAGNNTLQKNAGIECHGIDFQSDRQDLSGFTHIHFDFFTDDADLTGDVFNVKLVDFAGGGGEASALEVNINTGTIPAIVANSWVSVDVDITSLGGVVGGSLTRGDVAQIGITTANLTNVWYDNIYLHKNTTLGVDDNEIAGFKVYPNPSNSVWNIKSANNNITSVTVVDVLGKGVLSINANGKEVSIDGTSLKAGLYFATVQTLAGSKSIKLIKR
ncbi:T9SS type A sorting domain-containing protein [Algibacter mikhailovii]|uniref:Secretion system C-terminal sorting domain-containing protein n=1 Tax=Algibacter mikhailovii TaxID=425498 RepID=A0A918QYD3_9FLAO|nr:T9SS type A sorting domain-containing protein [Algibacter mikhailovii]GGZ78045.1 hypothetical protein GCM10007028_14340 [Algibacter mikhailovii]